MGSDDDMRRIDGYRGLIRVGKDGRVVHARGTCVEMLVRCHTRMSCPPQFPFKWLRSNKFNLM